jgi:hypothetical protein
MTRKFAKAANIIYYNNGVPCARNHTPIIRLTRTGGCYHCWVERKQVVETKAEQKTKHPVSYYLQFKRADGTFADPIGPFTKRRTAIRKYKKMYLEEYGCECPQNYL